MERIALLVDQIGKGDNIFENFAIEFEQAQIKGDFNSKAKALKSKIEEIERRLQDISEKITAHNEKENIYSLIIHKTRQVLSIWLPIYSKRNIDPKTTQYFNDELDKLLEYLNISELEKKNLGVILKDFETKFTINSDDIMRIEKDMEKLNFSELSIEWIETIAETMIKSISVIYKQKSNHTFRLFTHNKIIDNGFTDFNKKINEILDVVNTTNNVIVDSEDTLYTTEMKLWINTNDAVKANKFVNLVTEIIGSIDNVKITIINSGKGSYWQELKVIAKGWFAKEETKQILAKTQQAAESYALDRHIEPIEKSKIERKKFEEDLKRLMPEKQVSELHNIEVEKAKEELESLKLINLEKKLEIMNKMSQMLANGLVAIDSDYRIEMNGLLLLEQTDKKLQIGDINDLDSIFIKEALPPDNQEENE